MQTQTPSLDELELSSFVTSLPAEEQLAVKGAGCWSPVTWVVAGWFYDQVKSAAQEMAENPPPNTTSTSAGFFDTSYPCG